MGTSPTWAFRFSLDFQPTSTKKTSKLPKGAGLTKPMKLSADLADIVGKKEASRAECIKKNNLQDPENKQFFNPDKKMAKVFGSDRIRAFGMAKFLSAHLSYTSEQSLHTPSFMEPKRHIGYGLASTRTEFFNIFKF